VLCKTRKEQEWSDHFAPWFRRHLDTLKTVGILDDVMKFEGDLPPFLNFRKNQVLKIVLASSRFEVHKAESLRTSGPLSVSMGAALTISAVNTLTNVLHSLWKVESDGSIPATCIEVRKDGTVCLSACAPLSILCLLFCCS
jgi:hypothetical protein